MSFIQSSIKKLIAVFIVYVAIFMLVDKYAPTASQVRVLGLPFVLWYLTFLNYGMLIALVAVFTWIIVPQLTEPKKQDTPVSGKEVSQ
jgi:hypothetical protein